MFNHDAHFNLFSACIKKTSPKPCSGHSEEVNLPNGEQHDASLDNVKGIFYTDELALLGELDFDKSRLEHYHNLKHARCKLL